MARLKHTVNYKRFMLIMLALSACFQLSGQRVEIDTRIDSTNILIGDQVYLRLNVVQSPNLRVEFPDHTDTIVPGIEIIAQNRKDTTWLSNDEIRVDKEYLITSFDSGFHYIPPMHFVVHANGRTDTLASRPLSLIAHSVPVDTLEHILDIKSPYQAPLSFRELLPYIAIGLLLALIGILLYFWLSRKEKEAPVFKRQRPREPAHVIALRELERLKEQKLWQQGEIKTYYSLLTEIIRKYIENRYQVPAMEQTTDEIIASLESHGTGKEAFDELKALLRLADFVKFAKASPLPDENEKSFQMGYDFVRRTKYIERQETKTQETETQETKPQETETQDSGTRKKGGGTTEHE